MSKLTIHVYKDGIAGLFQLIHPPSHYSTQQALNELSLEELIVVEWRGRLTRQQLYTWLQRSNQKKYALKLSLPVAVALWKVLQQVPISDSLQELLDELTRELVDNGLRANFLTYTDYD